MTATAWITTVSDYLDTDYCDVSISDDDGNVIFHAYTNLKHDHEDTPQEIIQVANDLLREAGWQRTEHAQVDDFDEPVKCYCDHGDCDDWQPIESGAAVTVEKI